VHFGGLQVNLQVSGYYNVVAPDDGPEWQLRFQSPLMLSKSVL
jgi:hypothetical protein